MKIKICGMNNEQNILQVAKLAPNYMGFIFYKKSVRFVAQEKVIDALEKFPNIQKVAVFVDASLEYIQQKIAKHNFSHIQLHGNEDPLFCEQIKIQSGKKIIKTFRVQQNFDFSIIIAYQNVVDYILFDTKTIDYGGSGKKFDWQILRKYNNKLPVFLSGGLSLDNIHYALGIDFVNIHALDLNSCFEKEPALKDIELLKKVYFKKIQ